LGEDTRPKNKCRTSARKARGTDTKQKHKSTANSAVVITDESPLDITNIDTERRTNFTNAVVSDRRLDRGDVWPAVVGAQAAFVSVGRVQRLSGLQRCFPTPPVPELGSHRQGR
jgi:hypothetical protein